MWALVLILWLMGVQDGPDILPPTGTTIDAAQNSAVLDDGAPF